jgi:hypothetical protein
MAETWDFDSWVTQRDSASFSTLAGANARTRWGPVHHSSGRNPQGEIVQEMLSMLQAVMAKPGADPFPSEPTSSADGAGSAAHFTASVRLGWPP